ncbi:50S ribosomal protein L5 [Candidatus Micrarchaeota archaeon]|nr:50S ribosomal protein L5 [Candidatus Micrarchaeota archaeon]
MMKMKEPVVDKVTLNIGVGHAGADLENAKLLLSRISGTKAIETAARVRNPVFKIKKGDPIGAKTTLRGKAALELLKKALLVKAGTLPSKCFDARGNFSFGVPEYIDMPGVKYDPQIGIIGFDVCVTLKRRGYRVAQRRRACAKIGKAHLLTKEDGMEFARTQLGINVV